MENTLAYLSHICWSGWLSLLDYLAAHVLLCLVPAFVLAGFLSAMIPKEAVTRYLGPTAPRWISYPAAAIGGFILAVCSCTILPLFAGIWRRGAGLGPAVTFLFVGPAINILAISYTAAAIGYDIALARLVLSITFGIVIGLIMSWFFKQEEANREITASNQALFDQRAQVKPAVWVMLSLLVGILITGTLQLPLFTNTYVTFTLPLHIPASVSAFLERLNLTVQGAWLIFLMAITALAAWHGLENVLNRFNPWTYITLALVIIVMLSAAPSISSSSLGIGITGRVIGITILLAAILWTGWHNFEQEEMASWFWETWKFIKQIFPLLIVGVIAAGMLKEIIPQAWVQTLTAKNTLLANVTGVVFGILMYFPTLVEVPVARMFLDLGMARGPLLAYLLADPELSIQSVLVLNKVMGKQKTVRYVALVAIFSTLAGYLFGLAIAH